MPDYIYLLENRLSADQQQALRHLREVAREAGTLLFLTGSAVRDLTSGHAVHELEVVVHSNALKLKRAVEKAGGKIWGDDEASRSLYLCFPGTVRVDLISAHRAEYPKPGKPVYHWSSIHEDLRRRDFTVNAMAISLNEGSYGLLMDPLNGAADIEARTLRLVSNYGFMDEPALMLRATRLRASLGWELDPRSQTRYDNAREEDIIGALSAHERNRELEQIGHGDDGLKVLEAMEAAGWMKVLFPAWTHGRADREKLQALHDLSVELLLQGVHADMSAAQMQLLTAKLPAKELAALKRHMLRPGFVAEWNSLDSIAAAFQKALMSRENQTPSKAFKLFTSYDPEAVLWLGFTAKSEAVKERYRLFLKEWPQARQRIPNAQMLEMRITPELASYNEILHAVFLELIDGKLTTPEEIQAFLQPFSPPAPPPQVTIKRSRARRSAEARVKERSFEDEEESDEPAGDEEDLDDIGGGDDEDAFPEMEIPKGDLEAEDDEEGDEEAEEEESAPRRGRKGAKAVKGAAPATVKAPPAKSKLEPHAAKKPVQEKAKAPAAKPVQEKTKAPAAKPVQEKTKPVPEKTKPAPEKARPAAAKAKPAPPVKKSAKAAPLKAAAAKVAKAAPAKAKPAPKKPAKPVKTQPAKKAKALKSAKPAKHATKPALKKAASKPARKR
ncbi:MAG TPA: CCA tRNA nucleotidyltransferase [Terracidiphilus sp.]|nr:CCA tRNA nucleotidyltransferase [Terracidiphilus sp.]